MHEVEWIPLGPKLPLILKQQPITGAPLEWYWGVCSCVWCGSNIWFGSWQAHCCKANIVTTDVWWHSSGLWKIHLSSQLKLRGGREERDMGPEGLEGYPLCGPHLKPCGGGKAVCICVFVRRKKKRERLNKCTSNSWTRARRSLGVVLAAPFHLNVPILPLYSLLPYLFLAVFPTPFHFAM